MQKIRYLGRILIITTLITAVQVWGASQTLSGNGLTLTYDDTQCGTSAATCNSQMQQQFNSYSSQFSLPDLSGIMKYMSSAQSISSKGHGVDYTTNHSLFVFGANISSGFDTGGQSLSSAIDGLKNSSSINNVGFGLQMSFMAGVNLGYFKSLPMLERFKVYVHGGSMDYTSMLNITSGYTWKSAAVGAHVQYSLIQPKSLGVGLLNWGGVNLTSGLTYADNTLSGRNTYGTTSSGSGTLSSPLISGAASGAITLKSTALTVPLEVSTSVRVLYILSLFGGAAIDFNFGKATLDLDLSAPLTSTVNGSSSSLGTAALKTSQSGSGRSTDLRFFAGTAINLVPLKNTNVLSLLVQANASVGGTYGVVLGVRAGW